MTFTLGLCLTRMNYGYKGYTYPYRGELSFSFQNAVMVLLLSQLACNTSNSKLTYHHHLF